MSRRLPWLSGCAGLLLFVVFLVLPKLPENPATERLLPLLKAASLRQSWGMYAPNPARAYSQLELEAIDIRGKAVELPETQLARAGWGTAWAFTRSREDYWRYAVARYDKKRQDMNRVWYLRSICVREARAGRPLRQVSAYRVHRKFRPPKGVLEGRSDLRKADRTLVGTMECNTKTIREMLATHEGEPSAASSPGTPPTKAKPAPRPVSGAGGTK